MYKESDSEEDQAGPSRLKTKPSINGKIDLFDWNIGQSKKRPAKANSDDEDFLMDDAEEAAMGERQEMNAHFSCCSTAKEV